MIKTIKYLFRLLDHQRATVPQQGKTVALFCFMANYLDDFLILTGLIMLGIGLWQLSPTIMLIVLGTILLMMGILAAWRGGT